ncbi:hypothetical protein PEDI_27390 [Persicobacter diffluens]|uniref:Uncharacterized protein n=1 Tax=Persicobacter diffluens TaxID=981 RepID=A0AAN5AKU9_9BACT|nr:hypothetical protein PEDI_27390 [Persicobacter diffluens]
MGELIRQYPGNPHYRHFPVGKEEFRGLRCFKERIAKAQPWPVGRGTLPLPLFLSFASKKRQIPSKHYRQAPKSCLPSPDCSLALAASDWSPSRLRANGGIDPVKSGESPLLPIFLVGKEEARGLWCFKGRIAKAQPWPVGRGTQHKSRGLTVLHQIRCRPWWWRRLLWVVVNVQILSGLWVFGEVRIGFWSPFRDNYFYFYARFSPMF